MDFLSLIIVALIGILGYVYWVQGFVSGVISAVLAIVAALMALSFTEPLIDALLGGRMADTAYAMVLCALFAGVYLILRIIVDKLVPGNARFPAIVDQIGGAAGGVVSGAVAGGIIAIAAQTMPLGPAPLGSARYTLQDRTQIIVPGDRGIRREYAVLGEVKGGTLDDANRSGLWLPVDDMVVGLVSHASSGPLSGTTEFTDVYPDLLKEFFAARLGVPSGGRYVALNNDTRTDVTVASVAMLARNASLPATDGELKSIRPTDAEPVGRTVSSSDGNRFLVLRVRFASSAADADNRMRFSPGSAALVADGQLFLPVGILENGSIFVRQFVDDMLVVAFPGGVAEVDLVYEVPPEVFVQNPDEPSGRKMKSNIGFRFKRLARLDLSGKDVPWQVDAETGGQGVIRKRDIEATLREMHPRRAAASTPTGGQPPAQPATPAQPSEDGGAPGAGGSSGGAVGPDTMPQ